MDVYTRIHTDPRGHPLTAPRKTFEELFDLFHDCGIEMTDTPEQIKQWIAASREATCSS